MRESVGHHPRRMRRAAGGRSDPAVGYRAWMKAPDLLADFASALPELVHPWEPSLPQPDPRQPGPRTLLVNDVLATELGIDPDWLRSSAATATLGARAVLPGTRPVAQAYAGHQFGGFTPVLGDGRAVLLGELRRSDGELRDVALKGSGRTVFARRGDGRAVLGPVLREYLFGEAMHALGIPTTRALAVVTTGDAVFRDGGPRSGAVLTRVANSHLRIGTFELVARSMATELAPAVMERLLRYAAARHGVHHPGLASSAPVLRDIGELAIQFLDAVVERQAALTADWMAVGFVHGVMNTDNMAISGETIDYGPCAWLEAYDPDAVFSSIDSGGRYRFGQQGPVAAWNLARLAETLLPLISPDTDTALAQAHARIDSFRSRHLLRLLDRLRRKLGLSDEQLGDADLADDLLSAMASSASDYTTTWRALAEHLRSGRDVPGIPTQWLQRWTTRLADATNARTAQAAAEAMDAVNPLYVPRNHLVEQALAAADDGDIGPFQELLSAVGDPYAVRPDRARLAEPAPAGHAAGFVTFCGT